MTGILSRRQSITDTLEPPSWPLLPFTAQSSVACCRGVPLGPDVGSTVSNACCSVLFVTPVLADGPPHGDHTLRLMGVDRKTRTCWCLTPGGHLCKAQNCRLWDVHLLSLSAAKWCFRGGCVHSRSHLPERRPLDTRCSVFPICSVPAGCLGMHAGYLAAILIGIPLTINLCPISCLVGLWDTFAKCLHFLPILKLELSDACLACLYGSSRDSGHESCVRCCVPSVRLCRRLLALSQVCLFSRVASTFPVSEQPLSAPRSRRPLVFFPNAVLFYLVFPGVRVHVCCEVRVIGAFRGPHTIYRGDDPSPWAPSVRALVALGRHC